MEERKIREACDQVRMSAGQEQILFHSAWKRAEQKGTRRETMPTRVISAVSMAAVVILLCIAVVPGMWRSDRNGPATVSSAEAESLSTKEENQPIDGFENYLVMQVLPDGEDAAQSEIMSMLVFSLNTETGRMNLLEIPDMSEEWEKEERLTQLLGIDFTGYYRMDIRELIRMIDRIGGLRVDVSEEEISALNSYRAQLAMTVGIASPLVTDAGEQVLDGVQAVAWGRIRYQGDPMSRVDRNMDFWRILHETITESRVYSLGEWMEGIQCLSESGQTDLSAEEMAKLLVRITRISWENYAVVTEFESIERTETGTIQVKESENLRRETAVFLYGSRQEDSSQ
ncbi:MAG: LCP family protein [Lachnospiraceae bacterium]|nr:LCP family protein [Lachnospiraceae bacterium]